MRIVIISMLLILQAVVAFADFEFEWEPVTDQDWAVAESDSLNIHDAVILFDKGYTNDTDGQKKTEKIYRRIKIFNERGRDYAAIDIPYNPKNQKLTSIVGRTHLPDGTILELEKTDIRHNDFLKASKYLIKQKSFVLPGVVDGCIIEYQFKMETKTKKLSAARWAFQNDIYTLSSMYTWEYYQEDDSFFSSGIDVGYELLNGDDYTPSITYRPNARDPKFLVISLGNIPPLEHENFAPPKIELPVQVYCYYMYNRVYVESHKCVIEADGWTPFATTWCHLFNSMTDKDTRIKKLVHGFEKESDSIEERMKKAYEYVQEKIINMDYLSPKDNDSKKDYQDNENLDDVLKHGYGTSWDINFLYTALLQYMGLDAAVGLTVDRSLAHLHKDVDDWQQFDLTLVVVRDVKKGDRLFSPGIPFMPFESIPWYAQGMEVLTIRHYSPWISTLPDNHSKNSYYTEAVIDLYPEQAAVCSLNASFKGQPQAIHQLKYYLLAEDEHQDELQRDLFPFTDQAELTEFTIVSDSLQYRVNAVAELKDMAQTSGSRLLVYPTSHIKRDKSPFTKTEREFFITFDFPYVKVDNVKIKIPAGYDIEEMPAPFEKDTVVGAYNLSYRKEGADLIMNRTFMLKASFVDPEKGNPIVKELFDYVQTGDEAPVILKKI